MTHPDWGHLVAERFPRRDADAEERDWEALTQRIRVGQSVSGTVIAKAPFGAWIDLDFGFPALLEIIGIDGLTPEKYRADEWCPIGSEVSAFIAYVNDGAHQVRLSQVKRGEQ